MRERSDQAVVKTKGRRSSPSVGAGNVTSGTNPGASSKSGTRPVQCLGELTAGSPGRAATPRRLRRASPPPWPAMTRRTNTAARWPRRTCPRRRCVRFIWAICSSYSKSVPVPEALDDRGEAVETDEVDHQPRPGFDAEVGRVRLDSAIMAIRSAGVNMPCLSGDQHGDDDLVELGGGPLEESRCPRVIGSKIPGIRRRSWSTTLRDRVRPSPANSPNSRRVSP